MNKKDYAKILCYAKKIKAIDYLGGKCKLCGDNNWIHMEFHHLQNKKYNISKLLNGGFRWSIIQEELDKCVLYCRNCHQELHFNERCSNDNRQITKQIYIEYKGNECEECGYNKCQASLTFHHIDPIKKEIQFCDMNERINNLDDIKYNIIKELDKCKLLCCNCHNEKHIDIEFFERNKEFILNKANNLKEIQSKINKDKVKELYDTGMKQIEIAKFFNASKGTISGIVKSLNLNVK